MYLEIVFIGVILAGIAGELVGRLIRKNRIQRLQQDNISPAQYEIIGGLSPAEFGYLVDGTISTNELVAEYVILEQKGIIEFKRDDKGRVYFTGEPKPESSLNEIELELIASSFMSDDKKPLWDRRLTVAEKHSLVGAVTRSLVKKGWIKQPKYRIPIIKRLGYGAFVVASFCVFFLVYAAIIVSVFTSVGNVNPEGFLRTVGVAITIAGAVATIIAMLTAFRRRFLLTDPIGKNATQKFIKNWHHLNGLSLYIRISGMDTMTPDYNSLSFRDLDKLYPYAVALGADPVVVSILRNRV